MTLALHEDPCHKPSLVLDTVVVVIFKSLQPTLKHIHTFDHHQLVLIYEYECLYGNIAFVVLLTVLFMLFLVILKEALSMKKPLTVAFLYLTWDAVSKTIDVSQFYREMSENMEMLVKLFDQ